MSQNDGPQIFSGARDPTINGGTFNAVGGNMNIYKSKRTGMKVLMENVSPGAFHDSAERGDPPRCHKQTRIAILSQIMEWIRAPEPHRRLIIWLYGPAGAGKSAIEQTIAEMCEQEGRLAAAFFFGRTIAGRNDLSRVVATLAFQLLQSFPEIKETLLGAIEMDQAIFSRSLEVQAQRLIVAPLVSVKTSTPKAILIDGVDECGPDGEAQARLLKVLGDAAARLQHIPITFFIASRPEAPIRLEFNSEPLQNLTQSIVLDNNYKPDDDIRLYLRDRFATIHRKQIALGVKFPSEWPSDDAIKRLVAKSSGQFIYASTAVKFVDSIQQSPVDQLNIVLGMVDAGNEKPFSTLDALYSFILSKVNDLPRVLDVLTLLMLGAEYSDILTIATVECLLGCELRRVLIDMHALIFVPLADLSKTTLRIHHASLHDFLMDKSRSGDYFIDVKQGHTLLSERWLDVISQSPKYRGPLNLRRCIQRFDFHSGKGSDTTTIAYYLAKLSLRAVLERIDNPADLYGDHWESFFAIAETQGGAGVLSRFEDELNAFFLNRLHQYPEFWRPVVPALFCFPEHHVASRFFNKLIENSTNGMVMDRRNSNPRLLMLCDTDYSYFQEKSTTLFRDVSKKWEKSEVDLPQSYIALAKMFFKDIRALDSMLDVEFLKILLRNCAPDQELAQILGEYITTYLNKSKLAADIWWSLGYYMEKCDLQHTHEGDANLCLICNPHMDDYSLYLGNDHPRIIWVNSSQEPAPSSKAGNLFKSSDKIKMLKIVPTSPTTQDQSLTKIELHHIPLPLNNSSATDLDTKSTLSATPEVSSEMEVRDSLSHASDAGDDMARSSLRSYIQPIAPNEEATMVDSTQSSSDASPSMNSHSESSLQIDIVPSLSHQGQSPQLLITDIQTHVEHKALASSPEPVTSGNELGLETSSIQNFELNLIPTLSTITIASDPEASSAVPKASSSDSVLQHEAPHRISTTEPGHIAPDSTVAYESILVSEHEKMERMEEKNIPSTETACEIENQDLTENQPQAQILLPESGVSSKALLTKESPRWKTMPNIAPEEPKLPGRMMKAEQASAVTMPLAGQLRSSSQFKQQSVQNPKRDPHTSKPESKSPSPSLVSRQPSATKNNLREHTGSALNPLLVQDHRANAIKLQVSQPPARLKIGNKRDPNVVAPIVPEQPSFSTRAIVSIAVAVAVAAVAVSRVRRT